MALDCALPDLNSPTKELTYLLQLYNQEHIGGMELDYALCDLTSKMLKYLLELYKHDRIGDEVLNSALHVLKPPDKDMDMKEASYKPKQKEEIKEESYDEPWCMPGWVPSPEPTSDKPKHIRKITLLEGYECW